MAHRVFICHASRDQSLANAARTHLESVGIRCWIAPRDQVPGLPYGQQIVRAIAESTIVLFVFSAFANESRAVLGEIELASNRGKIILPLRIEDIAPSERLEYYIRSVHWQDAFFPPLDEHLDALTLRIQGLLGNLTGSEHAGVAGSEHVGVAGSEHVGVAGSEHVGAAGSEHVGVAGSEHVGAAEAEHVGAAEAEHVGAAEAEHIGAAEAELVGVSFAEPPVVLLTEHPIATLTEHPTPMLTEHPIPAVAENQAAALVENPLPTAVQHAFAAAVEHPIPAAELVSLTAQLAVYLGPVARVLVARCARKATSVPALREALGAEISDPAERREFLAATRMNGAKSPRQR